MRADDYEKIKTKKIGYVLWKGPTGLERVPGGCVMIFHDEKTDTITSSTFIPLQI